MAEDDSDLSGSSSNRDHPKRSLICTLLKLCWPLPGALAGAAVGFHVYFRQPGLNTDSAAPALLASRWAFFGLLIGLSGSMVAGWLIERGLRRWFSTNPSITASLTLLSLLGLSYVLHAPLEVRLPELFWPALQNLPAQQQPVSTPSPCTQAPPTERQARLAWDLECR